MTCEIEFTENALRKAEELKTATPEFHDQVLRVYLEGKGCDGFFYGVAFDKPQEGDKEIRQADGSVIIADNETLKFVEGSTVDWVDDERGQGFLVENPSHRKFRGKFYKRDGWEERLLKN